MGMPLDDAFGKFDANRNKFSELFTGDNAHDLVEHRIADGTVDRLHELRTEMEDVERSVEDELGEDDSTAVGQAQSMAREVIAAADALASDISNRDEGEVLGHLHDLERALDKGVASNDEDNPEGWRNYDHDPGGRAGAWAQLREAVSGDKIDPHFSGDPVTKSEAESHDFD